VSLVGKGAPATLIHPPAKVSRALPDGNSGRHLKMPAYTVRLIVAASARPAGAPYRDRSIVSA
jgi:hypothetical protein